MAGRNYLANGVLLFVGDLTPNMLESLCLRQRNFPTFVVGIKLGS